MGDEDDEVPAGREPGLTLADDARRWTIAGFVFAAIAVVLLPLIFGPVGAGAGFVGYRQGDRLGRFAVAAAVLGMLLGFWVTG
jgi:hypothetical protein